jgi:GNAT superfamily N-acetyltransferase
MPLMDVVLRDEPFDGTAASALLAEFASEIASLYPGWHPGVGPSADPGEFVPPAGAFVVAYADGRPVGCGGFKKIDEQHGEIKRLYVAPGARQSGIARLLLGGLEQRAREAGYAAVRLDTGARQPEALALFRSRGYNDIADYNGNEFASHWLEKFLPSSNRTGTTRPR